MAAYSTGVRFSMGSGERLIGPLALSFVEGRDQSNTSP
jgi:hypothetical protein